MTLTPELKGLLEPGAYPHPVRGVELRETHLSWVLLTGEYAYKVKRPVQFSFVDLRDPAHRAFLCHEEVRLNRRFAPALYLDVQPITLAAGRARIGGTGAALEHAVRMREFAPDATLDRLLARGAVEADALAQFGAALADVHAQLPAARPGDAWGEPAASFALMRANAADTAAAAQAAGLPAPPATLLADFESRLGASLPLLTARYAAGHVRECHADLHARNVALCEGRLQAFDCLEFDPALRWIDVADEIAFLLADLAVRGRPLHARAFLAGYLERGGDYDACALLPLYRAHRALVRAKVAALTATGSTRERSAARGEYRACLDAAGAALAPRTPSLVLMCGLAGSGKTSLARALAPTLGALHLRSDVERKRLAGLAPTARVPAPVAGGLYDAGSTARVYAHLARAARAALAGGYDVIVDASFARRAERARFGALGAALGVPTRLVHCQAPAPVLLARLAARRRRDDDASDAGAAVLAWQQAGFEPVATDEFVTVCTADTAAADVVGRVARCLASPTPSRAPPQLR